MSGTDRSDGDPVTPEELVERFQQAAETHREKAKEADRPHTEASHYGAADAYDQAWSQLARSLETSDNDGERE